MCARVRACVNTRIHLHAHALAASLHSSTLLILLAFAGQLLLCTLPRTNATLAGAGGGRGGRGPDKSVNGAPDLPVVAPIAAYRLKHTPL